MFMALVGRSLVVDAAAYMSDAGWSAQREKRDERRHPALPHRVPQADLDYLDDRLGNARWAGELPGVG
jgi:hypothetical protein